MILGPQGSWELTRAGGSWPGLAGACQGWHPEGVFVGKPLFFQCFLDVQRVTAALIGFNVEKFILQNSYPHRRQERDSENAHDDKEPFLLFLLSFFNKTGVFCVTTRKPRNPPPGPPKTSLF